MVGRAGRAFVDIEGQVLYPMFDSEPNRRRDWRQLVEESAELGIESGLVLLVHHLLSRMIQKHHPGDIGTLIEYVSNGSSWEFPEIPGEKDYEKLLEERRWNSFVSTLDTSILGLLGDGEIPDKDVEERLDEVLQSSLWARSLAHHKEKTQRILKLGLAGRVRVVFEGTTSAQRKAYFLAGVGLTTGRLLDANGKRLRALLVDANAAIVSGEEDEAVTTIVEFAEVVFGVWPFTPEPLPDNWRQVLVAWLKGEMLGATVNTEDPGVLRFVEDGLIYRLPWALEAVRVHGVVGGSDDLDGAGFQESDLGFAVVAVETGTLRVSAAVLMKAGFGSRTGAIKAAADGHAHFEDVEGLVTWARSAFVVVLGQDSGWPTPETHELWESFIAGLGSARARAWRKSEARVPVEWFEGGLDCAGMPVRLSATGGECEVLSSDFEALGTANVKLPASLDGVLRGTVSDDGATIQLSYVGPEELFLGARA